MPRKKTDERIREVRQEIWQRRKKRIRIILAIVATAIVFYGVVNLKRFLTSLLWNIKTFKVKEVLITPYSARPLITGLLEIETGRNLLFLDIDALREQIIKIREVENCIIRKVYPSTLEIEVVLRKPWIILENGKDIFFVDRAGKILSTPEISENLLRVQGINVKHNSIETQEMWKLEVLKEIEKWYNFYNLQKYFNLGSIRIIKPTEIILNSTDTGKGFILNTNISERFDKLKTVLKELEKNSTEWEYIDLRFQHPYVKHLQKRDER